MKNNLWDLYWSNSKKQILLAPLRQLHNYMFTKKIGLKNSKILEIGCGSGSTISMLKNYYIVGIDLSKTAVKISYRHGAKVIVADAKKLPFKNKSFKLAFALGVLEHCNVKEIKNIVRGMLRVSDNFIATGPKKNGTIDLLSRVFKFFSLKWIFPDEEYRDKKFFIKTLKKFTKRYELKIENFFFGSVWLIKLSLK